MKTTVSTEVSGLQFQTWPLHRWIHMSISHSGSHIENWHSILRNGLVNASYTKLQVIKCLWIFLNRSGGLNWLDLYFFSFHLSFMELHMGKASIWVPSQVYLLVTLVRTLLYGRIKCVYSVTWHEQCFSVIVQRWGTVNTNFLTKRNSSRNTTK